MHPPATQGSAAAEDSCPAGAGYPPHARTTGIDPQLLEQARSRLKFLYAEVARTWPGFIERAGQYQMMQAALLTFLSAKAAQETGRTGDNLAQLQAGTGTGKTVAYCLAAIVASELLKKTVVISTATVALQEQLFHKDLPQLAKLVPGLQYDILKGRGRYVCESRLEGAINGDAQQSFADDGFPGMLAPDRRQPSDLPRDGAKAKLWFRKVSKKLHAGDWDGDIDTLDRQPASEDWRQIQASASACNAGQCVHFRSCAFFKARRQAATATLQVANHALVLATLQGDSALIDAGATLFVFDEAHHLPAIAAEQFSYRARLGVSVKLLASLRTLALRHGRDLPASVRPDPVAFAQIVTECTEGLARLENYLAHAGLVDAERPVYRFAHGRMADELGAQCEQLAALIDAICSVVGGITVAMVAPDESRSPAEREAHSRAALELGLHHARLDTLGRLFTAWAAHDRIPWAKWIERVNDGDGPGIAGASATDTTLCASPMTAASILSQGLWRSVSAAVCTSATLTACGSFEFFDRLSGMNRFPDRRALAVSSPFDYAVQGELRIAPMRHSPKSAGFSDELCQSMPDLLREHCHGQLVLFTSRRQMLACHAALPEDMRRQVLMQGERSRTELLKEHGQRVENGQRSIVFGLQSFGEGIDLPGRLCEHVLIDKLPFTPPNSPVEEALAEWLGTRGRDPFAELSVPRAAMKLAQWAGRGVRTVSDRAVITICDTRLATTRYGQEMLAGLPPFPVVRPVARQEDKKADKPL